MNNVKRSLEIVTMRGTSVPLEDTLITDSPSMNFGLIVDLMRSSAAPTIVDGVVVMSRPDFCRSFKLISFIVDVTVGDLRLPVTVSTS
jgi:hypothetical protein